MRIVNIRKVEDCFDGSFIKEFEFDQEISEWFIKRLGQGNVYEYFADFPKPFFRIEKKDFYQIKGVQNSYSIKVIFSRQCGDHCVQELTEAINEIGKENFNGKDPGTVL